jgi:hypothetical protein
MITLQVTVKSVYGTDKVYPANEAANRFAIIAGTKTLTRNTLVNAFALGCGVEVLDRYGNVSAVFSKEDYTRPACQALLSFC